MSYATPEDVRLRYPSEMFDGLEEAPEGVEDNEQPTPLEKALSDASGLMDSYLTARYRLPLEAPSNILKRFCIDIALYWLANNRGTLTEEKRQRYADALQWLEQVAGGKIEMPIEPTAKLPAEPPILPLFFSNERLFKRSNLKGF